MLTLSLGYSFAQATQDQLPDQEPGGTKIDEVREVGGDDIAQDGGSGEAGEYDEAVIAQGKEIYNNNCSSCHRISNEVLVGPGLAGITDRKERDWLAKWIRNSQRLVTEGDPYATEVFNAYNQQVMPAFAFNDEEIESPAGLYCVHQCES
ncbi:MAG: c-type cytochrome [Bacteroidia bacterium]|nr:c-type cytochrome [Bacteroidia bacterium]